MNVRIPINREQLSAFCRKWRIREFALFGSVLREDFDSESDVDVLVSFEEGAPWNLWHLVEMKDELKEMFGREVDLLEKRALRNPFRKREILETREVIYAA